MHNTTPQKILGIDPGTAIVGWGIITADPSVSPSPVAYGHISTSKNLSDVARLDEIVQDLTKIITTYRPDVCAIEDLFFFKNQKTIITVAQARGVIMHTCFTHNIPLYPYTPLQVKQALTGYGRASKKQMQDVITQTLDLSTTPHPDDVADALAIALCHHHSQKFTALINHTQN